MTQAVANTEPVPGMGLPGLAVEKVNACRQRRTVPVRSDSRTNITFTAYVVEEVRDQAYRHG